MGVGQLHSYSATVPHKRMITDRVLNVDPYEIVALNALGLDNMGKFSFVNAPNRVYEWLEDAYVATSTTANDTTWDSDSAETTVTVTDGSIFKVGDVILADAEYMWVSAISGNDLTVTRDFGGTQATHATDVTVYIVARQRLEGASADDSPWTEPSSNVNYSQILQATIEVSRTDALIPQYGISGVVDRLIDKHFDELMLLLNSGVYHSQQKVGTSSTPRGMGNLKSFISTNGSAVSGALTRKMIDDELQQSWDNGGNIDLIMTGAWAQRKINDFYAGYVRTERSEQMGGIQIKKLLNPITGAEIDVVVDRDCPTDELFLLDREHVGLITIDPMFYEDLGKTKDTAAYGQIVGEYGLVLADEKNHSYLDGFSTSA